MSADASSTPYVFRCRSENARGISTILSSLQSSSAKKDLTATCSLGRLGMKFTVEDSRIYQANAFLQEELFQEYYWNQQNDNEQIYKFRVNLAFLLDCLNIFGNGASGSGVHHTTMHFCYAGYGHALVLILEEAGVITECALKTLDAEDLLDINFRGSPIHNKVEMDAEGLREAFSELDWSASTLTLLLSPDPPYFRASTSTLSGSFDAEYPKDSEVFENFSCTQTQENTYKLSLLQPCFKALANCSRTQIRMNAMGVLCFQHIVKAEDQTAFVDFFILPETPPDDDDN